MKDVISDANFPRTKDGRVYHLGIRAGEVANRIITVGSLSRAETIASMLDSSPESFSLYSERGFQTITGCYRGVPVSIVCIGMGAPNVDFFIREVRECVRGDMLVIRLGSCGCLTDLPVGTLVLPKASVSVTRNFDFDFANGDFWEPPYRLSKSISADPELHNALQVSLNATRPATLKKPIFVDAVNASTDSFYSSQGRQTSFQDYNSNLIDHIKTAVPKVTTLEMETFFIFHLAASWRGRVHGSSASFPPLTTRPVVPTSPSPRSAEANSTSTEAPGQASILHEPPEKPMIRAAAVQMVFASRSSQDFITPQEVAELEKWSGRGVLEALCGFHIPSENLHPDAGSVWSKEDKAKL
ncbi:purine and uridine phosphorylase [Hygrophoropsis aurantiaca]|uniref:Purine and uridine phosphorylase n=1 Tax=Hygrophoropsis aurantiaca TaxID=72124 RepID=A0ACB8A4X1_9AGAM|nr:purine and uridine phosphorylase [Hygrophoropsis aurantiaca]